MRRVRTMKTRKQNKKMFKWVVFLAITCLVGVVSSLEIGKHPYELSELSPELKTFENTELDPLQKEIFYKSPTGTIEYDTLLEKSNRVLILTKFGTLTVDSYYNKKKSNQDLSKELLAIKFLKENIPQIRTDWKMSIQKGQAMMKGSTYQTSVSNYQQCVRYKRKSRMPVVLTSALYRLCRVSRELQRVDYCVNRIYSNTPPEVIASLVNPIHEKEEDPEPVPDFIPQFSFEDEEAEQEKIKEEPKNTVELENEAIKHRKEGNYDLSIEKYKKANRERKESGSPSTYGTIIDYYNIAKIYYQNKYDPCEGAKWMKKGLELEEQIDMSKAAVNRRLYKKMERECRELDF